MTGLKLNRVMQLSSHHFRTFSHHTLEVRDSIISQMKTAQKCMKACKDATIRTKKEMLEKHAAFMLTDSRGIIAQHENRVQISSKNTSI